MKADSEARETGRVEAFSDGVFAIAITLLGFAFKVPTEAGTHLATALAASWPAMVAFVTSFATIGILWIHHHRLFTHIRKVDHTLLLLNGFLLMTITMVPSATTILADYLGRPGDRTAAIVYSALFIVVTASFNLLWRYSSRRLRLLDRSVDRRTIRRINLQYGFGPLAYLLSMGIAFIHVWASLAADIALAAFFALPALDWEDRAPPNTPHAVTWGRSPET
jgi:uncharacterized membrane protein